MSIELDFQRGLGRVFVNYTCGATVSLELPRSSNYLCVSANPIGVGNIDIGTATNWSGFNEFFHKVNGDRLELAWNVVEPESRVLGFAPCGIVVRLALDIAGDDGGIRVSEWTTRDFPSFELYQYRNGQSWPLDEPKSEHDLPDLWVARR